MENMKKTGKTIPEKKVFSYERTMVCPASLEIHPLLKIASTAVSNDIFLDFYNEFNFLEIPVVTEDGYVITHAADVNCAKELGIVDMEVVIMKEATQDDIIRFVSFKHIINHGKNRFALYQLIKFLTKHLTQNVSGKELAAEFETNKTRTIVAKLINLSPGTVQSVTAIGDKDQELLKKIDNGEITGTAALAIVKKTSTVAPFVSRKRYDGLKLSNESNKEKPEFNLDAITINFKEIGQLNFSVSGEDVSGSLNGIALEDIIHRIDSDYNKDGETQRVQSHTFIPKTNDRFSIQIIIRDLDQLGEADQLAIAA